jgi:hypothetical protein
MSDGKNELKTFTAAIIEALCDVRVKTRDSLPWGPRELFHAIKMCRRQTAEVSIEGLNPRNPMSRLTGSFCLLFARKSSESGPSFGVHT